LKGKSMKKLVAFVVILSLGLFAAVGCNKPVVKPEEKKPAAANAANPATKATEAKPATEVKPTDKAAEAKPAAEKAPEAKPAK